MMRSAEATELPPNFMTTFTSGLASERANVVSLQRRGRPIDLPPDLKKVSQQRGRGLRAPRPLAYYHLRARIAALELDGVVRAVYAQGMLPLNDRRLHDETRLLRERGDEPYRPPVLLGLQDFL